LTKKNFNLLRIKKVNTPSPHREITVRYLSPQSIFHLFLMPKDRFIEEYLDTPEKRVKLFKWILTAQIVSIILIVVGGIIFILWALNII
jgi:prolipoprotein diacylglyceryltransferase